MNGVYLKTFVKEFTRFIIPKGKTSLLISKYNRNSIPAKGKKYDYIILLNILEEEKDILLFLNYIYQSLEENGRLVIIYKNYLHSFFIGLYQSLTKTGDTNYNWLSTVDIKTFLALANFDFFVHEPLCFLGEELPLISDLFNKFLLHLFPLNHLSFLHYIIAKKRQTQIQDASTSIVVPVRNEEGNIKHLFKLPKIGHKCEIIFIEGHSQDDTRKEIKKYLAQTTRKDVNFKLLYQKGVGKADAVYLGFQHARGDVLLIYDADMSVKPTDLPKFYSALTTYKGDFINGSRLVYPVGKNAMQFANTLGNKCFSILYSFLLGQPIKDTLCGTKAFWRKDYLLFEKNSPILKRQDPFGDFYLLLSASKLNLKIIDLPIRYYDREYGSTNIRRFQNGWELFRFYVQAVKKLKMRML